MSDVLAGINYFAGWWPELPNKWHDATGRDWRQDYPGRVPLLGEYNDQETTDREIITAADYGVDFFQILWYYVDPDRQDIKNSHRKLNQGIEFFTASPEAQRMKFFIEFCNHPPFGVPSEAKWRQCIAEWLPVFRHPSYLRVGERLVFKVHGADQFVNQCSGHQILTHSTEGVDPARLPEMTALARERLDILREAVSQAGLGEMVIGGGLYPATQRVEPDGPLARLFDFTTTYMDIPEIEIKPEPYEYQLMIDHARQMRLGHVDDPVPYVPYTQAGWDASPWGGEGRPTFVFPTREELTRDLRQMLEDLDQYPNLGYPLPDGGRQKAFTIYAWNEFGEGGFMAPTKGDGYMKLEVLKEVLER